MARIMERLLFSDISEESRYREIIEAEISRGAVERFPDFDESASQRQQRWKKAKKEAQEAEAHARQLGLCKLSSSPNPNEDGLVASDRLTCLSLGYAGHVD